MYRLDCCLLNISYTCLFFLSEGTHNDIVVTAVASTALGTLPILIPDVRAGAHVASPCALTCFLGCTPFRDIVLLLGSLRPVGLSCKTQNHKFNVV